MPRGNIVQEVTSGCIIHQVNAAGVMGSGVAKELKDRYPDVWQDYSVACKYYTTPATRMGVCVISQVTSKLRVASIFAQLTYGYENLKTPGSVRYTSYDALDVGLADLATRLRDQDVVFHYPLIGAGRGGGQWSVIREIINFRLAGFEHHLWEL